MYKLPLKEKGDPLFPNKFINNFYGSDKQHFIARYLIEDKFKTILLTTEACQN